MAIVGDKSSSSTGSSIGGVEMDPLLKELGEKKQLFQRSVLSLASDLKDARTRLAQQEESFTRETKIRQEAEDEVKNMKEKIWELQRNLDVSDEKLKSSNISPEQDLDDLRSKLSIAQAAADASAALSQSAQTKYLSLTKELDEKNAVLKDYQERVNMLGLQNDLQSREHSQMQHRDEVKQIEGEVMVPSSSTTCTKDNKLIRFFLEDVTTTHQNSNNIRDDGFVRLTDEIRFLSMHWKHTTKELQSQIEKHQRSDLELKKRVFKLELCIQETRAQTRKLQRMGERRDGDLKELKDELAILQLKENASGCGEQCNSIWESSGFKIIVSMSMFVLVIFARR